MLTYYKVTSMEQLQKVYDIIKPEPYYSLYRYINKTRYCEEARKSFKECLRDYGQIYFDVNGSASCSLCWERSTYTVIDVGVVDRYNL